MRFLIVDDSPTVRLTLAGLLTVARPMRPEVVEAGSAAEVERALEGQRFDCVFLDMVLAKGGKEPDGGAVLDRILEKDPRAKVVVVTGLSQDDPAVEQAIMQGAFAYLRKPVHLPALRQVLELIEQDSGRMRRI